MTDYDFTDDMGEISGFYGSYEDTCRTMLKAGMEWLDANPKADPQFHRYKNVYGIISEDNEDAKSLSKAVVAAADRDCTGAMHQAVIQAISWIREHGWDKYVETMKKNKNDKLIHHVYKYPLEMGTTKVMMPKEAKILSFQMQAGIPTIWALVNSNSDQEERSFRIVGTGHPVEDADNLVFVGTDQEAPFVWHLFEVVPSFADSVAAPQAVAFDG